MTNKSGLNGTEVMTPLNDRSNGVKISIATSTSNGSNHWHEVGRIKKSEDGQENKCKCTWGSRMTQNLLKLQLLSIIVILWLGIAIYGCDFPAKTVLNQVLIYVYFFVIYSVGLIFGYYVLHSPSSCGIRIFVLFELVTSISAGILEVLSLKAISQHAELDHNPLTKIWGANMYSAVILANTLVLTTAIGLVITGLANSGLAGVRKTKAGNESRKCSGQEGPSQIHNEDDESSQCLNPRRGIEENGV